METRTYTGITPEQFAKIEETARQSTGINIEGSEGEASGHHVDIAWDYTVSTGALVFTLKSYPPFCGGKVERALDALVGVRGERGKA